jgi:hypothetical protein
LSQRVYLLPSYQHACLDLEQAGLRLLKCADRLQDRAAGLDAQLSDALSLPSIPWGQVFAARLPTALPAGQYCAAQLLCMRADASGAYVLAAGFTPDVQQWQRVDAAVRPILEQEFASVTAAPGFWLCRQHEDSLPEPKPDAQLESLSALGVLGCELLQVLPASPRVKRLLTECQIVLTELGEYHQGLAINGVWFFNAAQAQARLRIDQNYFTDDVELSQIYQALGLHRAESQHAAHVIDLRRSGLQLGLEPGLLLFSCGRRYRLRSWHRWRVWRR